MAWFQKSVAGLVAGGVRKAARGEYDLAITDFSAAIQLLEPDDLFEYVEVFTCRADAYADDGQYDNALADYDKAIKNARSIMNSTGHLWRFSPSALFCGRGRSYLAKGDYDRAIADFNESIHHDKYSDAARAARGRAYYVKKDYDRAIADFRQLVGDDLTSIYNKRLAEVYAAHGFAYATRGQYSLAIADYEEAIRLNPEFSLAIDLRAAAVSEKGRISLTGIGDS